ncbi:MAG: ISAzo13 family transposase, partial [Candidatus Omnitrophica bacterium]|nr:ISAzo13 family transposase [Candidatus Omnitrophota bacterium]
KALGRGGIAIVIRATGLTRNTIVRGITELACKKITHPERVRCSGAGRKRTAQIEPGLMKALEDLVEPVTRGDPDSPLRWTSKSTRHLAKELNAQGYKVSHTLVAGLLQELNYSLQGNRKTLEGTSHPDLNAQFEYINKAVKGRLKQGEPTISVDTKKKELVGRFKNIGREWRSKGSPEKVNVHDFPDPSKSKAIPYGVYDLGRNLGWVSVGIDHDTAAFAVATIRRWWRKLGRKHYPQAKSLLITADSGGSNGSRLRLWKWELQKLANQIGMAISVCHLPPGTSKWNKIEHRLFSFISQNWRGQPLLTHATVVNLISATKTNAGLRVHCILDDNKYPKAIKPTAEQMSRINLKLDKFHGDWNYTISPDKK